MSDQLSKVKLEELLEKKLTDREYKELLEFALLKLLRDKNNEL
ncbi:hypothetical protein [Paenibacillus sp. Marseille-Q4541]|nr:hypothetical protein [Paenibacillus sp. Marseille-Q4541]